VTAFSAPTPPGPGHRPRPRGLRPGLVPAGRLCEHPAQRGCRAECRRRPPVAVTRVADHRHGTRILRSPRRSSAPRPSSTSPDSATAQKPSQPAPARKETATDQCAWRAPNASSIIRSPGSPAGAALSTPAGGAPDRALPTRGGRVIAVAEPDGSPRTPADLIEPIHAIGSLNPSPSARARDQIQASPAAAPPRRHGRVCHPDRAA
jgi:hypothetical protein